MKKPWGENDVGVILQRLDRLTLDEVRATAAQTLDVIHGLVRHMRVVMDGRYLYPFRSLLAAERTYVGGKGLAPGIWEALGMFQVGW